MALIACPECTREVSDKATACPHCGTPITAPTAPPQENTLTRNRGCADMIGIIVLGVVLLAALGTCTAR